MRPSVALLVLVFATLVLLSSTASGGLPGTCNSVCGRDYNPICGEYQGVQKTFSNRCMMEYYNCLKGTDFVVVVLDECVDEAKS